MANTTSTATLDLKVNLRALAGLDKKLKKVFSRQTPREFNTEIGAVSKSLQDNVKQTLALADALTKVERGTKAYKQLKSELREANEHGQTLRKTLDGLDRSYQRMHQTASRGGGGGGGRGGAMMGRVGGTMRRTQLPMPGIGAMGTALSAIPVAGLVAAGSMMAAGQTYQSRLRYEQARMSAAPYLMESARSTQFSPTTRQVQVEQKDGYQIGPNGVIKPKIAGRVVNETGTGRVAKVGETGLTEAELAVAARERRREMLGPGMLADIVDSALVTGLEEASGLGAMNRNAVEKQILQEQRQMREREAPTLAEVLGGDPQQKRERAKEVGDRWSRHGFKRRREMETGTSGPVTRTVTESAFDSQSYVAEGIKYGVAPAQSMEMAATMSQAAGRPMSAQEFGKGLALQRTTGVDLGASGQAVRQLRYAGQLGGTGGGNMEQVADLIGQAVAMGLEGSEISEYLQEQTGFLGAMAKKGIGIDIDKMRALEASVMNSGVVQWRADDISRQFIGGAQQVGKKGAQSAEQFRLMRAFGFSGEGGLEEFFKVRMGMQSPGLASKMGMKSPQEAMSRFIEQFRMDGVGAATQAGVLQQAFSGIGTEIGPEEAFALSQGLQKAKPGEYQIDTKAAQRLVGATAPSVRAEAGIEAERVAIGGKVAGAMQNLERTTNNMAGTFENVLGPALDLFSAKLESATAAMEAASQGGVGGGPMDPWGMRNP